MSIIELLIVGNYKTIVSEDYKLTGSILKIAFYISSRDKLTYKNPNKIYFGCMIII